jgi:hypothetical protein
MRTSLGCHLLGFWVWLYPVGHKTHLPLVTSATVNNNTGVLSSPTPPVCCPSASFMGLAQMVSKPPLITHQLAISPN